MGGGGGGGGGSRFWHRQKEKKKEKERKKIHVCSAMVSLTSFSSFYFRILHHLYFGVKFYNFFFLSLLLFHSPRGKAPD